MGMQMNATKKETTDVKKTNVIFIFYTLHWKFLQFNADVIKDNSKSSIFSYTFYVQLKKILIASLSCLILERGRFSRGGWILMQ